MLLSLAQEPRPTAILRPLLATHPAVRDRGRHQCCGSDGKVRPATGRDFRHGAAVNQVRQGAPLSEVQQQLGHARIDTTTIYTKLAARERLAVHAGIEW